MTAAIVGREDNFVAEGLVREAVEVLGLLAVGQLRLLQTDRPEELLRVALAARRNLWPTVAGSPGLMPGRTLKWTPFFGPRNAENMLVFRVCWN